MRNETGGERDALAPVIPLFGGGVPRSGGEPEPDFGLGSGPESESESEHGPEPVWHSSWIDDTTAPDAIGDDALDESRAIELDIAERTLLRRLRTRSLSISEARAVVAERDLDDADVDALIAVFQRNGYLDDAALAEQVVHVEVDRKGRGRQVVAQTLAKRGIPRDVADAALSILPDDDAQRALEFARGKARSMSGLDPDTALRRLAGQLARRGYPGSVALDAARRALAEQAGPGTGVRFR